MKCYTLLLDPCQTSPPNPNSSLMTFDLQRFGQPTSGWSHPGATEEKRVRARLTGGAVSHNSHLNRRGSALKWPFRRAAAVWSTQRGQKVTAVRKGFGYRRSIQNSLSTAKQGGGGRRAQEHSPDGSPVRQRTRTIHTHTHSRLRLC